jgi:ADP-ribose pyrophosphatase YjhB (NUDIX family)
MIKYVAGFMFGDRRNVVALVQKARPAHMRGLLNGIGGHIEANETPAAAMVREFHEETGLRTEQLDWMRYARLVGKSNGGWEVEWFWSICSVERLQQAKGVGDEPTYVVPVAAVLNGTATTMPNLSWLLSMALASIEGKDRCRYHVINEELAP